MTTIDNIGAGKVVPGTGFVKYPIKYKAILFRPFKGEVVDAVVTQVNKVRECIASLKSRQCFKKISPSSQGGVTKDDKLRECITVTEKNDS